jgi:RecA/RadA recombinase
MADLRWAGALGVRFDDRAGWHVHGANAEQELEAVHRSVESGAELVILDSIPALVPAGAMSVNAPDSSEERTRLVVALLRSLPKALGRHGSTVLIINHMRHTLGRRGGTRHQCPPCDAVMQRYADLRLRLELLPERLLQAPKGILGDHEDRRGSLHRLTVTKRRHGEAGGRAHFAILWSPEPAVIDVRVTAGAESYDAGSTS